MYKYNHLGSERQPHVDNPTMEKRYIIAKRRSEQGKLIRRQYRNDIGVPYQLCKGYSLMLDGYSNTITAFCSVDNQILELQNNTDMELTYHEHPTKKDLLEYFGPRIRVRKMHEREALRLMSFRESTIDKIMNAEIRTTLKSGVVKVKKMSKTQIYKQAGNGIDCNVIKAIGRTLWISDQPENTRGLIARQMTIFDML